MTDTINKADLSFDFTDASVLVTGGTSGIGAAIAAAYSDAGADVTITGTGTNAPEQGNVHRYRYLQLELTDNNSIDALASQLPRLDILVNNAGAAFGLEEFKPEVFARSVQMLLTGVYRLCHNCLYLLGASKRPGGGAIVNLSSSASFMPMRESMAYGAAKSGLNGLTRSMAVALGDRKIRVNAIAPGLTRTPMSAVVFENEAYSKPTRDRTPLQRLGEVEDMTSAVLFLSSAGASFITGQTLSIDGGFTIQG